MHFKGFPHLMLSKWIKPVSQYLSPSDQRKFSSGSSLIQFESASVERPLVSKMILGSVNKVVTTSDNVVTTWSDEQDLYITV